MTTTLQMYIGKGDLSFILFTVAMIVLGTTNTTTAAALADVEITVTVMTGILHRK